MLPLIMNIYQLYIYHIPLYHAFCHCSILQYTKNISHHRSAGHELEQFNKWPVKQNKIQQQTLHIYNFQYNFFSLTYELTINVENKLCLVHCHDLTTEDKGIFYFQSSEPLYNISYVTDSSFVNLNEFIYLCLQNIICPITAFV